MNPFRRPDTERPRRPRSVYSVGTEADPRFSLANERTMLAWLRTALAFVVTGVALIVVRDTSGVGWTSATAATVTVVGAVVAPWAYLHWRRCERALRLGRPLPAPGIAVLTVLSVIALAVITTIVLIGRIT